MSTTGDDEKVARARAVHERLVAEAAGRTPAQPGWIGAEADVLWFLEVVVADRDDVGKFLIGAAGIIHFLGRPGGEVVVPGDTVYFVSGQPVRLAAALRQTSYGMSVAVY